MISLELFLIGFTSFFGPCLLFCSPVVLPYVVSTKDNLKEGVFSVVLFSFVRLIIYISLGVLAGIFGKFLVDFFHQKKDILFVAGGVFIAFLGTLIVFEKNPQHQICKVLKKNISRGKYFDVVLLAFVISILPCIPFLGVLAYIVLQAENFIKGGIMGLSFGLGVAFSQIILFIPVVSIFSTKIIKHKGAQNVLKFICGFLLFFIGIQIAVSKFF